MELVFILVSFAAAICIMYLLWYVPHDNAKNERRSSTKNTPKDSTKKRRL